MNRCESRDVSVTVHGDKVRDVGEYSLMAQLGKGGFSVVRHAIHRGSHKEYACKILDQEKMNAEEAKSGREAGLWKKSLCLEIACMKLIKHRYAISPPPSTYHFNTIWTIPRPTICLTTEAYFSFGK